MEININNVYANNVDFDIVGKGNVLLDIEYGTFDCSPTNDETVEEFTDFILQNIDEIIHIIETPKLDIIKKELINFEGIEEEDLMSLPNTDEEFKKFKLWCEKSLVVLIEAEEYELCSLVKKLLSFL